MALLGGPKLKIDPDLYRELSNAAKELGYSSTDEMAEHLLREALRKSTNDPTEEERKLADDQLRGLGYLK